MQGLPADDVAWNGVRIVPVEEQNYHPEGSNIQNLRSLVPEPYPEFFWYRKPQILGLRLWVMHPRQVPETHRFILKLRLAKLKERSHDPGPMKEIEKALRKAAHASSAWVSLKCGRLHLVWGVGWTPCANHVPDSRPD